MLILNLTVLELNRPGKIGIKLNLHITMNRIVYMYKIKKIKLFYQRGSKRVKKTKVLTYTLL